MSGLAHYFESEGIATTSISLVREHSEQLQPPRALWVPFELGRPLGVPGDREFQMRVMMAALELLDRPSGPVLEDFPDSAPTAATDEDSEGWACPVHFAQSSDDALPGGSAVASEIASLAAWYDLAVNERGRTTVGLSGLEPAQAAKFLQSLLDADASHAAWREPDLADRLRFSIEDLKAYYLESATAQPGASPSQDVNRWLWHDTALSDLLRQLAHTCERSDNESVRLVATSALVPRSQAQCG